MVRLKDPQPSDDGEVGEEEVANATAVAVAEALEIKPKCSVVPEGGLVRHTRYRTVHAKDPEAVPFKTACGLTFLPNDFEELSGWPAVAWPLCRRGRCAEALASARP